MLDDVDMATPFGGANIVSRMNGGFVILKMDCRTLIGENQSKKVLSHLSCLQIQLRYS